MSGGYAYLFKFIIIGDTGIAFNIFRCWEIMSLITIY